MELKHHGLLQTRERLWRLPALMGLFRLCWSSL